ncbi:trichohyalin-like [Galleria mellonella]|uniref:Trichohyalin-like n=1 Tax=Galleria mellonella TaxID=7137 RepID=A0A6J3BWP9_GALME|nr:trichohyalin-like [Galleria mellonella]
MPIALSKAEWGRIVRWTEQDKEDPENVHRRKYVQYLDATSREMTKSWPNSVENVNKRNEELRRARIEAAEQANTMFYKRYVRRKREEQQRLMHNARDTVFKNKDAPKLLLSAVIETVIQKERQEQLKFLAEQRQREAEHKKKDDDDLIRKAKEWHELMELKRKRRFEANKQHQKDILDQAREVAERNRIEYEAELNLQKIDNIRANQEMADLKDFKEKFCAEEKARIWADMERSRHEAERRSREQAARGRRDERLLLVLQDASTRVHALRTRAENELKEEKLRVLEKISQKLESGDAAREAKEQAILEKAIKEKEAAAEARREAHERKKAQFKQDRIDTRNKFLRDEEQRLHEFNTMRQWEIMNRFKNAELYEDFKDKSRLERERKIKEYRDDILKQWREREECEARWREETRQLHGPRAELERRRADRAVLARGAALLRDARRRRRPERPLRRALHRYCKLHRLYPMPELAASMQEHFESYAPRDDSQLDPNYTEPAPPPTDLDPDASDPEDQQQPDTVPQGKKNGLQEIGKAGLPKLSEEKEEKSDDYKRKGRANGLQRKNSQKDLTLPRIKAPPCPAESCRCETKK